MSRIVDILLVEDHPADVRLTKRAFQQIITPHNLHVVIDGLEALSFLRKEGRFADAPMPHLILLDLNMPRKDGKDVLREVRQDGALRHIPIVILTTSSADEDILDCYRLGANSYIVKPVSQKDFVAHVQVFDEYWFRTSRIP